MRKNKGVSNLTSKLNCFVILMLTFTLTQLVSFLQSACKHISRTSPFSQQLSYFNLNNFKSSFLKLSISVRRSKKKFRNILERMNTLKISIVVSLFSTLQCHVDCHNNFSNDDSSGGIAALILARGGSKGIKMKNIQIIDGTTLLGISLKEIQKAEIFESIWVSTDNDEIAKEGLKCM